MKRTKKEFAEFLHQSHLKKGIKKLMHGIVFFGQNQCIYRPADKQCEDGAEPPYRKLMTSNPKGSRSCLSLK